jgi:imidazolonepropionase-like amidohydrolase
MTVQGRDRRRCLATIVESDAELRARWLHASGHSSGNWCVRACITIALACTATAHLRAQAPSTVPVDSSVTAFVGVTVIPMDSERRLVDQTVVVADGLIRSIAPAGATAIPAGARRVEGRGRFLMPGLMDTHVHIGPYTTEPTNRLGAVVPLLLANGVTTARSMVGHDSHIALKTAVAEGRVLSPRLILAAPQITGPNASGAFTQFSVSTPEAARQKVRAARDAGFDLVKITFGFTSEIYDAVAASARELRMPLSGHVTPGIAFDRVLAAGQQVEHLDGYLEATVADSAPVRSMGNQAVPGAILRHIDRDKIKRVAEQSRRAGIANSPTLSLFQIAFIRNTPVDSLIAAPGTEYFQAQSIESMRLGRSNFWANAAAPSEDRSTYERLRNEITKALANAGALLLAGSDSPQHFQMYGFALHAELRALVGAGLSPYQALATATRNPAEHFGVSRSYGTVAQGKVADLILLDADPLASVDAAARPAGVMLAGRWFPSAELENLRMKARP